VPQAIEKMISQWLMPYAFEKRVSLSENTPWHFAESGGRDVALARGKVRRAAWPLNPEKGDANFMAAARLALGRRPGVHG
jgi:hypothetical protein